MPADKTTPVSIGRKLAKARKMFLDKTVRKSGKNMHIGFKYFELEDIVPSAIEIFDELGIVTQFIFSDTEASVLVWNVDNPNDELTFTLPFKMLEPNKASNVVQALGACVTYYRRYLYMLILDICEPDEIEANIKSTDNARKPVKALEDDAVDTLSPVAQKAVEKATEQPKKPATAEERQTIKKELVSGDKDAMTTIKKLCAKLLKADEGQKVFVTQIKDKTDGFTKIDPAVADKLIERLNKMVEEVS